MFLWLTFIDETTTLQDLLNVQSGAMERHLSHVLAFAVHHVVNCPLCRQKGFVCELCEKRDVIYPFEADRRRVSGRAC